MVWNYLHSFKNVITTGGKDSRRREDLKLWGSKREQKSIPDKKVYVRRDYKYLKRKDWPFFSFSVNFFIFTVLISWTVFYLEAFSSQRKRFFTAQSCENWNGIFAGLYFYNFKSSWNFTFIAQKYHFKSLFACFFVICFMGIQRFKNCSLRLLQINKASVRLIILLWAYRGFPSS